MKKRIALVLACVMALSAFLVACGNAASSGSDNGSTNGTTTENSGSESTDTGSSDLNVAVFYYTYADVYVSTVRAAMDSQLNDAGITFQNFDANSNQTTQTEQINTAITNGANVLVVNLVETSSPDAAQQATEAAEAAGIPIIFFNREVADEVIQSYDQAAFVGTDTKEAGHMQGAMIAEFLLDGDNYDATDLNGDGTISYVMFKGQEGNPEADFRTQYSVEDADAALTEAGKPALEFYDANNNNKYLVDQNGNWSAQAATDYMTTILAEYNMGNNNMVELVIANNDDMAQGAISALQAIGFNNGDPAQTIPVFGVDAVETARQLIADGFMTGTVSQDAVGMATSIVTLIINIQNGDELMANTDGFIVDPDVSKIRVPYGIFTGEE